MMPLIRTFQFPSWMLNVLRARFLFGSIYADQNRKGVIIQSSHDRNLDVIRAIHDPSSLEKAHELLEQVDCEDIRETNNSFYDQFDSKQLAALGRQIQSQSQPCLVFDASGRVLVANAQADTLLGARSGLALRDLEVCDVGKMAIGAHLKDLLLKPGSRKKPCFLQVQASRLMRGYTIVLEPPTFEKGIQPHVVAHLVEGTHAPSFQQHIAEVYHLTSSESAVLSQFMSGRTLEQIAVSRRRSAATVKKQFYGLMSKFKVKSQSELLQHVMTLAKIKDAQDPTLEPSAHPYRQETKVLRPHGRVVEVVLAGDMFGTPVLMVPTLFQRCFPAQVEQHLKGAGILMITVVPPGRGKTSHPHQGTSDRACFVNDIVAVLDQLSIVRAILFGTDDILRLAVLLAQEIPERLAHILVTAPVLPISYEKASRQRDNFIPSSKKLQLLKPAMKTLSLALFWQSLTILHAKGMIRLFLRNDPVDLRICLEPDTLREVGAAFDSVISVGFETGAKHHLSTFDDWETHIDTCPVPITIYEGTKSRLCDRAALRRFVDDFPEVIKLVEFETAGTSFPYVRPDLMIEMLVACQVRPERCG